jgi:PKD repeat protein
MEQGMLNRLRSFFVTLATLSAACTIQETPAPSLMGPSEYATSVTLSAVPDLITRDGVSQSTIVVTANDPQGAPVRSLQLRLDMVVNGVVQDFGTLSTRTLFTNADGRATATYTAPPAPMSGASVLTDRNSFVVTPVGSNAQGAKYTSAEIRLVLPITTTPGAPVAQFSYNPTSGITTSTDVQFDASGSYPVAGVRIVRYTWHWGDTSPLDDDNGDRWTENHDWASPGTYAVTLTVTDDRNQAASTTQFVTVK